MFIPPSFHVSHFFLPSCSGDTSQTKPRMIRSSVNLSRRCFYPPRAPLRLLSLRFHSHPMHGLMLASSNCLPSSSCGEMSYNEEQRARENTQLDMSPESQAWLEFLSTYGFTSSQIENMLCSRSLEKATLVSAGLSLSTLKEAGLDQQTAISLAAQYPQLLQYNIEEITRMAQTLNRFCSGIDIKPE